MAVDRELLMEQARLQAPVTPEEVSELVQDGSIFFRLLGNIIREEEKLRASFIGQDLVTEEGRLRALKEQGKMVGRSAFIDYLFDFVVNGASEENADRSGTE